MNIQLKKITADQKDVLNNLMEKYLYDFRNMTAMPSTKRGSSAIRA